MKEGREEAMKEGEGGACRSNEGERERGREGLKWRAVHGLAQTNLHKPVGAVGDQKQFLSCALQAVQKLRDSSRIHVALCIDKSPINRHRKLTLRPAGHAACARVTVT